ncbi:MAG: hypothetical protein C4K49_08280 [Candidatus Thorarchaeota archaeon]|nr:MAG: hypothetical protein C4K49_08280 [Candidatus Thorarchaeota archaeon]
MSEAALGDYKEIWNSESELVNRALGEFLDLKVKEGERLGAWVGQYYGNVKGYVMRGGKRLRPVLVAAGYRAVHEKVDVKYLYRAACSIEILHNGSLLHDDLIDHDETRRGGPTFHALYRDMYKKMSKNLEKAKDFGTAMAILGGDSLLNMGAEMIVSSELDPKIALECIKYYQHAYHTLAEGVLLETIMTKEKDTTPEAYLEMIRMKTAVLFEDSLLMGATIAQATQPQLDGLREFGTKVGQAFQVQDDILGSFGDESITGKAVDGDIKEGKKTMLVIESYRRGTPEQKKTLDEHLGRSDLAKEDVEQVKAVFKDSGALKATQDLMRKLLTTGQKALETKPPLLPKYKRFLLDLSAFLVERNY